MFIENSSLPLQPDVAGAFDKAGEVPFGLDVLSSARILGPFLKHDIDHLLGPLFFTAAGAGAPSFPFAFFPFGILDSWRREKTPLLLFLDDQRRDRMVFAMRKMR